MPKRQKDESEGEEFDLEEELSEEVVLVDEDDDYDEKPKKKKAAAKKPAAKKPAAKKKADEEGAAPKPKKAKAPPPPKVPTTLDDGWVVHPPSLIYKPNPAAQGGTKIAAIDLDGTLISRKSSNKYGPLDQNDWMWYNPDVPAKVKAAHADGHQILIVSNQGGIKGALLGAQSEKVRGLIDNVLKGLEAQGVPAQVLLATNKDEYRKPSTGMWDFFVNNLNKGVVPNKADSFFIGDAAGRDGDINEGAASDKEFAENVGIAFHLPEDYFGAQPGNAILAAAFMELANLLREKKENFKANAFNKVAAALKEISTPITSSKDVKNVPGIGKSSLAKIDEFLTTGKLAAIEEIKTEMGGTAKEEAPKVTSKTAEMAMKFL